MKKQLLLLFLILSFSNHIAQVVFSPPGAEWRVLWYETPGNPQTITNRSITYARDTVISSVSYKVLQHHSFFSRPCANINSGVSVIKQSGDTIFFRNANSSHTWQILYNFAATAGQSWTTAIRHDTNAVNIHTVTVQSVGTVTVNNFPLRQMSVTVQFIAFSNLNTYSVTMIERLGSSHYPFYFRNQMYYVCHLGGSGGNLCYEDNAFGLHQYDANKSCDFTNVGLPEYKDINAVVKLYPNPATSYLAIDMDAWKDTYTIRIQNVMGQAVQPKLIASGSTAQLEVEDLPNGIYLLQVFDGKELKAVKKFRKE